MTKYQLCEGHLSKAIQDILSPKYELIASGNKNIFRYKEAMLEFQDLVRDVPVSSLNMAAFWLEFIDRHKEVQIYRIFKKKGNFLGKYLPKI